MVSLMGKREAFHHFHLFSEKPVDKEVVFAIIRSACSEGRSFYGNDGPDKATD